VHGLVAAVFKAAVRDRVMTGSPCEGVKLPKKEPKKIVPLLTDVVRALADAVPELYRALVVLAAGTGLRQGEVFGLTLDRVDFLRRTVTVDRTVPLPQVVAEALAKHLRAFPVAPDGLLFTTPAGEPLRRTAFSSKVWRPAVTRAGLGGAVFHELRHYYASLLIRHAESVKVVQARLGHATAAETLDTYSHLWPDSEDRTREAVDVVLGAAADSVRTSAGL
jgi:integrase